MKTLDQFYPYILPEVMGCPNPVVDFAILNTCREVCSRTAAWCEWAASFVATGLTQRHSFVLPATSELVAVRRATVNGIDIDVLGSNKLPDDWENTGTSNPNPALIHISMTEYMLYPMPSAGDVVRIEMRLKPTLAAVSVGDALYDKYAETVAKGALYRLMSSSGKAYTNLPLAQLASAQFESGIHLAANEEFRQTAPRDRKVKSWG